MSTLDDRALTEIVNRAESVSLGDPGFEEAVTILRLVDALRDVRKTVVVRQEALDALRGRAEQAEADRDRYRTDAHTNGELINQQRERAEKAEAQVQAVRALLPDESDVVDSKYRYVIHVAAIRAALDTKRPEPGQGRHGYSFTDQGIATGVTRQEWAEDDSDD